MTPIEVRTKFHGYPARLTPTDGGSADYDPASTEDYDPGPGEGADVTGFWEEAVVEGLPSNVSCVFVICATERPAGLQPDNCRLQIAGAGPNYLVVKVRARNHLQQVDGYECWLQG